MEIPREKKLWHDAQNEGDAQKREMNQIIETKRESDARRKIV